MLDGGVVGWGATVEEVNQIVSRWDEIVHIACLHDGDPPAGFRPYSSPKIKFVPLKPTGGARLIEKLNILANAPNTVRTISREIRGATNVQLRTPTGIGVYLLPVFSFLMKRNYTFWVKYAGNWNAPNCPNGYRFQRWWLLKNLANCKVTINGAWAEQPEHCLSFENPCLTTVEIAVGRRKTIEREFQPPFRMLFVGRLQDEKGVTILIEALKKVGVKRLLKIDFVGDGPKRSDYERRCSELGIDATFHGFLDRTRVHELMSKGHFLLLPSESEGFPKVVAEAACYGCVPIVSNVGSIGQYIDDTNGYLWQRNGERPYSAVLNEALSESPATLYEKAQNLSVLAEKFTFDRYVARLNDLILNK